MLCNGLIIAQRCTLKAVFVRQITSLYRYEHSLDLGMAP